MVNWKTIIQDKDFTSLRRRMRNLKVIKQIFYAGPLNLLCSNTKIISNRHYRSIFLGDNWNYAIIITVLTRLLMFAVRKVLVQSRITIVTSSSQSPVKSSTLQLWSCVIVNFVLAFQVTQWDLGQTQYFDLCATQHCDPHERQRVEMYAAFTNTEKVHTTRSKVG